jgi:hypothetical protein
LEELYRVFEEELYIRIPHYIPKAYKLSIIQGVERWIVCTPLSVNVFVTFATQ